MRTDYKHNSFSILRDANDIVYEDVLAGTGAFEGNTTLFFAGCSLSSYTPSLAQEVYGWLKEQGEVGGISAVCCGKTLDFMAAFDAMGSYQTDLAQALVDSGTTRVITACPNCYSMLKQVCSLNDAASDIELLALPEVLVERGITIDPMRLEGLTPVTVHDSCPDRCGNVFGSNTRILFGQVDQIEMEHYGTDTLCCGAGGLVSAYDPSLCETRTTRRVQEALDAGAGSIMCSCISCLNTLTQIEHPIPTHHYLEYIFDTAVDLSSNGHTADRLRSEFTAEELELYFADTDLVFPEGDA
ncbi:MAG: hypothetical protein HGA54_04370 [Actinobacteria bacterium]|nr:hypothetical protein [Actinomycetota bacterium]